MATHWKPQNKCVGLSYDRCLLRSVSSPSSCPMWRLCSHSYPSLSLLSALFKRLLLWVAFWAFISLLSFSWLDWVHLCLIIHFPRRVCIVCVTPESPRARLPYAASQIQTETKCHTNIFTVTHSYNAFEDFAFLLSFPDASAQSVLLWTVRHRVNHWRTSLFSIIFKHYVRAKRSDIIYSNSFLFMLIKSSGAISQLS